MVNRAICCTCIGSLVPLTWNMEKLDEKSAPFPIFWFVKKYGPKILIFDGISR